MPNLVVHRVRKPAAFEQVKTLKNLIEFVGPNWPIFVYGAPDDPTRPGDT